MASVDLDVADLAVPDNWIPAAGVARVLDLSAAQSGHADFGLRLAELRRLATLGPLSVVLREEPDLRSALDLLTRYQRSFNEALHLRMSESNELVTIQLWLEIGDPRPRGKRSNSRSPPCTGSSSSSSARTGSPCPCAFHMARPQTGARTTS
ncbi:MAG: hypothetical protein QOF66_281, partial [Mycobacterium sp.]|nr:hypothetical protein [Mycobacterium sp.]